jgi:hypothetical protein
VFGATTGICDQELYQRRCCGPVWDARECGLELQDALTLILERSDVGFDPGEGLGQLLLQESINRLVGTLKVACGENLKFLHGESQGAQALDHLHTPERFFPKQTVVALAAAQGVEEPEILVFAQDFDRDASAPRELSNGHRMRPYHSITFHAQGRRNALWSLSLRSN